MLVELVVRPLFRTAGTSPVVIAVCAAAIALILVARGPGPEITHVDDATVAGAHAAAARGVHLGCRPTLDPVKRAEDRRAAMDALEKLGFAVR